MNCILCGSPIRERRPPQLPRRDEALRIVQGASKPLKGLQVALRLGCPCNAHLRAVLAGLVKVGLLASRQNGTGGYWPAGKPLPKEE